RYHPVDQVLQRGQAQRVEHVPLGGGVGTDVAADELVVAFELVEAGGGPPDPRSRAVRVVCGACVHRTAPVPRAWRGAAPDGVATPAVVGPESFTRIGERAFPFGERPGRRRPCRCSPAWPGSEPHNGGVLRAPAVRGPERFRGGCSFGADLAAAVADREDRAL